MSFLQLPICGVHMDKQLPHIDEYHRVTRERRNTWQLKEITKERVGHSEAIMN